MANETVSLELLIETGNSAKTLGDLKANFEKLNQEIEKVDTGSEEFRKLQTAITQTGAKVKNLELSLESLDKEQVATAIGGVAGGIGDVTTALVLLGGENENLEKMAENISTGIAVSMGLKGTIEGLSDGYKLFNNLMKVNATVMKMVAVSSRILKVALISTGIGAIVVILGTLFTNLDTVKNAFRTVGEYIMKFFKPQMDVVLWVAKKVTDHYKQVFAPVIKAVTKLLEEFGIKETETAKKTRLAGEEMIKSYQERGEELKKLQAIQKDVHDKAIAQMDREIALAKANGKDTRELELNKINLEVKNSKIKTSLHKQSLKEIMKEIKQRIALKKYTTEELDELHKKFRETKSAYLDSVEFQKDIENNLAVFNANIETEKRNKQQEYYKKAKADRKEEAKRIEEDRIKAEETRRKQLEDDAIWFKQFKNKQEEEKAEADAEKKELELEQMAIDAQRSIDAYKFELDEKARLDQEAQDAKNKMIANGLRDAQNSFNMLSSINDAFLDEGLAKAGDNEAKKEKIRKASFERQKTINVALATIDGAKAVSSIIAQYPKFDGGIAMAGALASAIITTGAQLNKIKNTKYNSSSSGSTSTGLRTGNNTSNAVDGVGINPVTNTSTVLGDNKVYVVESDITNTQNKVMILESQSTF